MSKTYGVKVYSETNTYLTTWDKDVVDGIKFNNEINSAGGQMVITLARNAGDYGEGSDVDFGYRVKVYCFDKEAPDGEIIFQGYISAYTPIYSDNKVDVTVMGYGSELSDFILEGGDTTYLSQLLQTTYFSIGDTSGMGSTTLAVLQTFVVAVDKTINSIDLNITTLTSGTLYVYLMEYTGTDPVITGESTMATGSINLGVISQTVTNIVFDASADLASTKKYYILVEWSGTAGKYTRVHASAANPYAGGKVYTAEALNYWYTPVAYASHDLYFNLYEYGGNTTDVHNSEEPTAILKEIISNYQSNGGTCIIPPPPLDPFIQMPLHGSSLGGAYWGCAYAQTVLPSSNISFNLVQLYLGVSSGSTSVMVKLCQGDPSLDLIDVTAGTYSYIFGGSNAYIASSETLAITNTTPDITKFQFSATQSLSANTSYYFLVEFETSSFGSLLFRAAGTSDLPILYDGIGKLYQATLPANNMSAAMEYTTTYPAYYISLMYAETVPTDVNGGYVSTATTVSYTFKVNTILEAIQKCLELSPKDWYWYIDQSNNSIQFRLKSTTPDHVFSLEKDIIDAKFEKRIEDIVNVVYFSGGDIGGGVNLFKKYINEGSITKYGKKSYKYSDQRVTVEATATTISNSILESKSEPELRVTLTIVDSNTEEGIGYDIESIKVGDLIAVRNVTQQVGLSTWDVARWDEAYWDFNVYNLSSLQMQVQKIDYNGDTATIYASTIAPDVNKRIEDINRQMETLQTLANPTSPT